MAVLKGYAFYEAGTPIVGATVNYYTATEAAPTVSLGNTTTDANGMWTFTGLAAGRYDVRIDWDTPTRRRWRKGLATDMVDELLVNVLRVGNPAFTFHYTITSAAIVADRVLNLPLLTAADTVVVLAMPQTFLTGVKTFNSGILAIRNPADTFSYTIAGGAILADRIITLPVVAAGATLAVLSLAQTWTAAQTFDSPVINTALTGTAVGTGASQVAQGSHTHAGSGVTHVGGSASEVTFTNTAVANLVTVSGLSIAVGTPVEVVLSFRKDAGAAGTLFLGLKLNTTEVRASLAVTSVGASIRMGFMKINFIYGRTGYLQSGKVLTIADDGTIMTPSGFNVPMPTATLTDIVIIGYLDSTGMVGGIQDIHVYTYATS